MPIRRPSSRASGSAQGRCWQDAGTLGWLAAAGYGYQALRVENAQKVRLMSRISGALGVLMVVQTLAWLAGLAVE